MKAITKEWQMYPVGVVFGMGFDTATEVALLLTIAILSSSGHIPWYAIICLPILFTAGMSMMDTTDGMFMNLAYGWAFFNPVRKVYYNLAITGLSVAICVFIGAIETLGLLPYEIKGLSQTPRVLGPHVQLQHQHRRFLHRRHVRLHLGRGHAHLALRPHRGEVERPPAGDGAVGGPRAGMRSPSGHSKVYLIWRFPRVEVPMSMLSLSPLDLARSNGGRDGV